MEGLAISEDFWRGKRVLLTGHTGFKGSWLALWLQELGAELVGVSLDPPTDPSLFSQARVGEAMDDLRTDIRDAAAAKDVIKKYEPEVVFHLAAQPLVRHSYREPVETYATNVMGTLHVLEGIRAAGSVRAAVMVTSDKCYENREWEWGYRENDPMGGHDPYSSSKGAAELLIASFRRSYFADASAAGHSVAVASARSGNVIGGGDWAEDRLVPDLVRAFMAKEPVLIRSPGAVRPWQHVLEPLSGYLMLAQRLYTAGAHYADAWNFGPAEGDVWPVQRIVSRAAEMWGQEAEWKVDERPQPHEANYLKLDCSRAHAHLAWWPRWNLDQALARTIDWYKSAQQDADMRQQCISQINDYQKQGAAQ